MYWHKTVRDGLALTLKSEGRYAEPVEQAPRPGTRWGGDQKLARSQRDGPGDVPAGVRPSAGAPVPVLVAAGPLRWRPPQPPRRVPPALRRRLHAPRRRQRPVRDALRSGGRPRGL